MARRLAPADQGAALVFAALFLPILIGIAALAVDISYGQMAKERMKFAADAAATGAALALPDVETARQIAKMIADANAGTDQPTSIAGDADITFGVFDTDTRRFVPNGGDLPNAIQVTASRTSAKGNAMPAFFSGIFGKTSLDVAASSVAVQVAPPCVVTLDPSSGGYRQFPNSDVQIPHCGLHANGLSGTAIEQNGSNLRARTICSGSGVSGTMTPKARTGCASLRDPMLAVPEPPERDCRVINPAAGFLPQPDCSYSGQVILSGYVNLAPGLYDFRAAQVLVLPGAQIFGNGVMLFIDRNSSLTVQPNTKLDLRPPTQGPYAGLTLFQARQGFGSLRLFGSGETQILGTIYAPSVRLSIGGRIVLGKTVARQITIEPQAQVLFNHWTGTNAVPALSATNVRTTLVR